MAMNVATYLPRVPVSCFWELTEACNLRCIHCEANAAIPAPDELSTAEALGVLESLAQLGCENVYLTGGEPLLRQDWPELARKAHSLGMVTWLISNGVLVDANAIRALQDAGVFGLSISLDGTRDVHDKIRLPALSSTPSSYDSAIRAIRLGVASELKTAVISLVHRNNLGQLREMHELLVILGVEVWQVQVCMPLGRMRHHRAELLIEPEDLPDLERELAELIEDGRMRIAVGDNIGYYGRNEPLLRGSVRGIKSFWMGCFAGCRIVALCANGDVKGCPSHPRDLVVGNVRDLPLAEIWGDEKRFHYNTAWDEAKLAGACKDCPHAGLCRAGCTTMAHATSGTYYENPYCISRVQNTPSAMRGTASMHLPCVGASR
jgi:radical SAM protein with 4Fe4S-binding SPASM domain